MLRHPPARPTSHVFIALATSVAIASTVLSAGIPVPVSAGELSYRWVWPIAYPHPVIREFRAPENQYASGHRGLDIDAPEGAAVLSPASGVVLFADQVGGRGVVTIDHGADIVSTLEPVEATVVSGQPVIRGEVIGILRSPSNPSSSWHFCTCLHVGARFHGQYVSPRTLLERAKPAVLKPWGSGPPNS